jgi:hypothetical protein
MKVKDFFRTMLSMRDPEPKAAAPVPVPSSNAGTGVPAPEPPGDFQRENADLIASVNRNMFPMRTLWRDESAESRRLKRHPQRIAQADELAELWNEAIEKSRQFYRQWRMD